MMASWNLAFFAILALSVVRGQELAKQVCKTDKSFLDYNYNAANVILGVSLSIRNSLSGGVGCGKPSGVSMQYLEAVRFGLNYLNNFDGGRGYLPGVIFGMKLRDSCHNGYNSYRDLQQLYPQSTTFKPYCSATSNKAVLGVLGPYYSSVSEKMAAYAKELMATLISPSAVATHLSDTKKYPTFFRTIPTISVQMRAMASLFNHLQWRKVIVLHTDDAYATSGYEQFIEASKDFDICVTQVVKLKYGATVSDYKNILQGLGPNDFVGGVISTADQQARMMLEAVQQVPELQRIHWVLIDVASDIPISSVTLRQMKGAFAVMPKSINIPEFRDYFVSLLQNPSVVTDNPWFKEWYEEVYQCSLNPGSPNRCTLQSRADLESKFAQSPYILPVIKAVFAYAEAFKVLCPSGSGVCSAGLQATPQDIQNALKSLDFTFPASVFGGALTGEGIKFDANGDTLSGAFTVFQYNDNGGSLSFKEVGEYKDGTLRMGTNVKFYNELRTNTLAQPPKSLCAASGCTSCILPPRHVYYEHTTGDIIFASLVNGHGHSDSLFSCGPQLEKGLSSIVAFQWAIQEYKRKNVNKLRGVSLGSLVANVCPNGAVAAGFLNDLFSPSSSIQDAMGLALSSRGNIYGFLDDTGNMMAKVISPILSQYNYPEIQVGATTPDVSSGNMYPYYARAIPNEEMYLKALTSLLRAKSWTHVQVATMKNPYYSAMSMRFRDFASRHGICVVSTSYFDEGASKVLANTLSDSRAFVLVTFGHAATIKELFDEIKATGNKGNIQVVSGMAEWGTDPRYFDTNSEPEYAITLALRREKNTDFENYLLGLSQAQISVNPFLTSLFEVTNKCSLVSSSRGKYARICSAADRFSPYQGNAPYMIQAIYNMADALHEIIADVCQTQNYFGLCMEFNQLPDIRKRLSEKVKNSVGISNGEGTTDIVYYIIRNGVYQEFGSYETSEQHLKSAGGVNNNLLNPKFNQGTSCPGVCLNCQYLYTFKDFVYQPGDIMIAGAFGIRKSGPESLQPFVCGDIRTTSGPLKSLAMMYALNQVRSNSAPVSAKGVTFGGIAFDHCGDEERLELIVSDIYSGLSHHSLHLDQTDIMSWIITGSGPNRQAATLLNPLDIPMISPDATSEALPKDYDNFYRTVQGDASTSNGFIKISKQLGFRYLQIVYAAGEYGVNSKNILVDLAQSEGICVTQALELSSPAQASDIVDKLMDKQTRVVVIIGYSSHLNAMFQQITSNEAARNSMVLMLPEQFKSIIDIYGDQMKYPPLSVSLKTSTLSNFISYLESSPVDNVFFASFYMKLHLCNLEGYYLYNVKCSYPLSPITKNVRFSRNIFDLSTINAVYATVDAVDRTIKEYCGADYTEPCTAYLQAPDQRQKFAKNLQRVSFIDEGQNAFRFLQKEGNVAFGIFQYNKDKSKQIEVGSYAGVTLNLGPDFVNYYKDVQSACSLPCLECINTGLNFSLTPGDIYLGGLFDVHQSSFNPFICGRIKTLHGFLLQEAFHYAISQVNSNDGQFKDILNGVTLGGVGLDACSSQVRGGQLVSNINNKMSPLTKEGVTVDPSLIDVYIGSYTSTSSRYLARILNDLKVPQISYAAGTTVLSDQRVFPYFFRTIPSNIHQARAILAYLNKMDIRYIQVLYASNTYGISGRDELVKLAAEYKICVAQTVEYPELGIASLERSKAVVSSLMEKPAANTVVTFLETSYINSVLRAIGLSDRARGKLRFVGSDTWADSKDAIDGADSYAVDSITFQMDADDVVDFENFINSKTLSNSAANPWFEEYYQEIHNCHTTPGNPYGYSSPCSQSLTSIISSVRYQQDPNVITVMNAVYASAFAIHKTLTDVCGVGYKSVCQAYRNNKDRRDIITKKLDEVEFVDPIGSNFTFTDREVLLGYRVNAIESGDLQGINYQEIGMYNTKDKKLAVTKSYKPLRPWNSGCDREDACSECPAIRDSTIRYAFYQSPTAVPYNDAPVIVAFFDIHEQGADPYRCGKLNMGGFMQYLSFLYSADSLFVNEIQGNVGLGAYRGIRLLAVDTCSNPVRVDQDLFGLLQGTGLCNSDFKTPNGVTVSAGNIGSIIVSGDMNTMAAARLLEQMGITYISPNAKSPLLDKKKHLGRSITPISGEMRFLAELSIKMDWSYMDVMYEETPMGYYPFYSLQKFAQHSGICLGKPIAIGVGSNDQDIERYLGELNGKRGSKVVVLLGSKDFFSRVMSAASRIDVADDYIWIFGSEEKMDKAYIESVSPDDKHVKIVTFYAKLGFAPGYSSYVTGTTYTPIEADMNNRDIPKGWFEEAFQMMNNCTMSNAIKVLNAGSPECSPSSMSMAHYDEDPYILNTILATYAASKGLRTSIQEDITLATGSKLGGNRERIMKNIMGAKLALSKINVAEPDNFEFNNYRWWDSNFVVHYWNVHDQNALLQTLTLEELPSYRNLDDLKENLNISSMCMETEKQGYCGCDYRNAFTAALVAAPGYIPSSHRNYYKYDDDGDRVYDWPIWAIAMAVLTGLGLLVTVILFLVLLCAYPRRGGTSILGYLMIIGIMGIYGINFAFFMSATDAVCGARRFLMGVVYTITFAPLLIKALDNWRFGHVDYAERRYTGISSACALLMCAIAVILIQCIIPIMWLILEHPEAHTWSFGNSKNDNDWCSPADDYDLGLVLSFAFVVFVVLMTGILSALSYQTESNNYESRWILFSSVATAGCFLVWMIVTTNAKGVYRDPTVAIANFVNATILLMTAPLRKTVLMVQAKRSKGDKESDEQDKNPYDMYSESYVNPGYELSDYDQVFMEKPSEF